MVTALGLPRVPKRIEVYDNSHIQGSNAVGAMIVAGPEGFRKNQYRKFNIKSENLTPGDDFAMMREVLTRRFKRLLSESPRAVLDLKDVPQAPALDEEVAPPQSPGSEQAVAFDGLREAAPVVPALGYPLPQTERGMELVAVVDLDDED